MKLNVRKHLLAATFALGLALSSGSSALAATPMALCTPPYRPACPAAVEPLNKNPELTIVGRDSVSTGQEAESLLVYCGPPYHTACAE